ncbi:TonB-dependent receptor [Novosphingobium aquae]|uniref:TonB-dependent receptor n=1 Tax=Novosphingobium aquae TaxID=3133435 RepID=A0ABU8SA45_9SPHN
MRPFCQLSRYLLVGVAFGAVANANVAQAQDSQAAVTEVPAEDAQAAEAGNSGEIIVTAQKRAENLQKVPVSVGVITGEQLDVKGIDRAIDAALQLPGVVFQQSDEARTSSISIRGIGSNGVSEGFEPSVSAIIDGEVYARTTSLTQSVADVERVEVLRGPQGTLFGKNTSAGAISVITKRPVLNDALGQIQLRVAQHDEQTAKGFVNVPIGGQAALRVNGFYQHIGGWLDNAAPSGDRLTRTNAWGVRAQLLIEPTDNLSILLRGDYSRSKANGTGTIRLSVANTAAGTSIRNLLTSFGQPIGPEADVASADSAQYSNIKNKGISADIAYSFSDFELRSQTFLRNNRLDEARDGDALPIIAGPKRFAGFVNADSIQQEVRLTSPKWGWGDFILGAFYYRANTSRDAANEVCTQLGTLTPDNGGTHSSSLTYYDPVTLKVTDCQGAGVNPYNTVNDFSTAVKRENGAIFGNVNFNLSEKLKAFAGARYLKERTSVRFSSSQAPTTSLANPFRNSRLDDAFIARVGAQYFFTPDINIYGSYSTGYKGPTFNDTGGSTPTSLSVGGSDYLEPEHSRQGEIGLRSQFFDRTLTVNLTGFLLQIDGFQERVSKFVDLNGDGVFDDVENATINAGRVESRGAEWDISWRTPIEALSLTYAGSYTDAYYKDFGTNILPCPTSLLGTSECFDPANVPGTSQFLDPTGRPLARAPKWQHNISARYRPTLDNGSRLDFGADVRFQSSFNFGTDSDPQTVQRGYGIVDLSAGWTNASNSLSVNVFVKNLFDKRYYSSILEQAASLGGGYRAGLPRDANRYVGGSVRVNF